MNGRHTHLKVPKNVFSLDSMNFKAILDYFWRLAGWRWNLYFSFMQSVGGKQYLDQCMLFSLNQYLIFSINNLRYKGNIKRIQRGTNQYWKIKRYWMHCMYWNQYFNAFQYISVPLNIFQYWFDTNSKKKIPIFGNERN